MGCRCWVLPSASFICPECSWPSFLACFQTLISFHQRIMLEDFSMKTGWEMHLSVGPWRIIINVVGSCVGIVEL